MEGKKIVLEIDRILTQLDLTDAPTEVPYGCVAETREGYKVEASRQPHGNARPGWMTE